MGPFIVHMFEAEQVLMYRFIHKLLQKKKAHGSYYKEIVVLNYTEDIPYKAYVGWTCKSINTGSATKEIKELQDFEKVVTIYEGMLSIGSQAKLVQ